jgi:hypothetical protein
MRVESPAQAPVVEVELGGLAPADMADRVRGRILSLGRYAPRAITGATVRFSAPSARTRATVVAHATLSLRGSQLVAFGAGATVGEATDRVRTTLRRQLLDLSHGRRGHQPAGQSTSDESLVVTRHVTRMPPCASPEQAVLALEQLGLDFGLYVDSMTGREAALWRMPNGTYEFAAGPAVVLTEAAAIQRLTLSGEPWLFFADERTGRGRVAHRRGDHSYGLIVS